MNSARLNGPEPEDTVHALWSCPLLDTVWEQQAEWDFCGSGAFGTFKELVEHVVEEGKDLAFLTTIVWTVWHRRNAMRTSSNPFPVQQIQ